MQGDVIRRGRAGRRYLPIGAVPRRATRAQRTASALLAAAGLLAAGGTAVLGAPAPASASSQWTPATVAAPSTPATGASLSAVSCAAGGCTAVGEHTTGANLGLPVAFSGGSGSWSSAVLPAPSGALSDPGANPMAVSCSAASSCVAVGSYYNSAGHEQAAVFTETSGTWTAAPAALPLGVSSTAGAVLQAVSCASATSCAAVGTYEDGSGVQQGLLEVDSSGTWSATEAPVASATEVLLDSVSCLSSSSCVATGYDYTSSGGQYGLLFTDSSGSWTKTTLPLPSGAPASDYSMLQSVSCGSPSSCVAVGYDETTAYANQQGLLVTDSSGSWSAVTAPLPAGESGAQSPSVTSVFCASSTSCAAGGAYVDPSSGDPAGWLLTDSSGSWSAVTAPLPSGDTWLASASPQVACPATGSCYAVAPDQTSSYGENGLLLTQSGASWSGAAAPLPGGTTSPYYYLGALSCATACVAIGGYVDGNGDEQGLLVSGSAGSWSAAEVPSFPPTSEVSMTSVSCTASASCAAVGTFESSSEDTEGLVASDGSSGWSLSAAPLPAGAASNPEVQLHAVTCGAGSSCVAVGSYFGSNQIEPLWESDSGGTWTASNAPLPSGAVTYGSPGLSAVACASATSCVAAGNYFDGSGNDQGLLETDSSGSLTAHEAPLPSGASSTPSPSLASVSCPTTSFCAVAGAYNTSSYNEAGLLLKDSSGTWSATRAPLPSGASGSDPAFLSSISCASATSCVAVGYYVGSNALGLIETESGGTWVASTAPQPANSSSSPDEAVDSVSCTSATSCTAIGTYEDSSGRGEAVLLTDSSGSWSASEAPLPSGAATNPVVHAGQLSCYATAECGAAGTYTDSAGNTEGLLLLDSGGSWSASEAALPGASWTNPAVALPAVACAAPGGCAAVGNYDDAAGGADALFQSYVTPCSAGSGQPGCAVSTSLSVTGGTLAVETPPQLYWDVVLDGYDQWASASAAPLGSCSGPGGGTTCAGGVAPTLEVLDATGSASGWAVSGYLSPSGLPPGALLDFNGDGPGAGDSVDAPLSTPPFAGQVPATACDYASSCTPASPASSCSHAALGFTTCPGYPAALGTASGASSQVDLYSASAGSGMGAVCLAGGGVSGPGCAGSTPEDVFVLALPANDASGSYSSSVVVLTVSSGP